MAGKRNRRRPTSKRRHNQRANVRDDSGPPDAISEIERVLVTPLVKVMDSEEEQAHARELSRQADLAPVIGRFRVLLAFIGDGRKATQAGKLTPADAIELAGVLGVAGLEMRSMEDLPDVPRLFHTAVAAELLAVRGTRVVPGAWAAELERDSLSAWFKVATTLLAYGLLDGFRRGWRKHYVEFLDSGVPYILNAILHAGGRVPVAAIEASVWEQVASTYGYQRDDAAERHHVDRLVQTMFAEFEDLGATERSDQEVWLTELGGALAVAASALVDDDAPSA